MNRIIGFVAVALLLCWGFAPATYAQQGKYKIYIQSTAPDFVGQRFVYELRERINASSRYAIGDSQESSLFHLRVVTIDPENNAQQGVRTVYSVVLTTVDLSAPRGLTYYMTSWVGSCGANVVSACAANIVASTDGEATPYIELLAESARKRPHT
jgi:hypothetical protein